MTTPLTQQSDNIPSPLLGLVKNDLESLDLGQEVGRGVGTVPRIVNIRSFLFCLIVLFCFSIKYKHFDEQCVIHFFLRIKIISIDDIPWKIF